MIKRRMGPVGGMLRQKEKFMGTQCDAALCTAPGELICLHICEIEHIIEQWLCKAHAIHWWLNPRECWCGLKVAEKQVADVDGHEPYEKDFYRGQWVAVSVSDNKVVAHNDNHDPQALINEMRQRGIQTNVYKVEEA